MATVKTIPQQPNRLGGELFTITEKQAKQRQDGSWYMETVKTERSTLWHQGQAE